MRHLARSAVRVVSLLAFAPVTLLGQAAPPAPQPTAAGALTITASLRSRVENWDWFGDEENGAYTYVGNLLRIGIGQQAPMIGWRLEASAPFLFSLPDDAVLSAPRGALGLGAAYYLGSDSSTTPASIFLKQAFVRIGRPPGRGRHSLRLGRFEFLDGAEKAPAQPTLGILKREHIVGRLIGTFGFTHVGRSSDGAHYVYDSPAANVTLAAFLPTSGAFDVNGWSSLNVRVGYGALTRPFSWGKGAGDWRVFALQYQDRRDVLKTDNRPAAARAADQEDVGITTLGAHYLHVFTLPRGDADLLLWGAVQTGDWGGLSHRATGLAAEVGYMAPPISGVRPWLRAGYWRGSGDSDPADDQHETFFQVLPTVRAFARFPIYNLMNTEDLFGSFELRGAKVSLRADMRALRLAEERDLWYLGSGAFEKETFGYAGRPSGGRNAVATLTDLSLEYRPNTRVTLTAYSAWARGRGVVANSYASDRSARFFYLEGELRK